METKSLIVGVLIGVCICLGAMLVFGEGVETAQAGPVVASGRYQIAVATKPNYRVFIYVLDQVRGDIYVAVRPYGKDKHQWERMISGPPK